MKKIMYMHGGSENHGCEALVRTTRELLGKKQDVILWSWAPQEDIKFGIEGIVKAILANNQIPRFSATHLVAMINYKIFHKSNAYEEVFLKKNFKNKIAVAIGGDNYCYSCSAEQNVEWNKTIRKVCKASVLWGCSIDESALTPEVQEDLRQYDLITAREQITYQLLKKINPNTIKVTDSAFLLEKKELPLPKEFVEKNTVGINVSPLIMEYGTESNLILQNYENLMLYILENTDMNICLIPHVCWEYSNDLKPLNYLYNKFKNNKRICMLDDMSCIELKGYISRCKFFVGARTHATIAAYSSCVPTLVVGYSVKSRGIAKDLFGTDENYVLPVQKLIKSDDLQKAFKWIEENEAVIKSRLESVMPQYIENAKVDIDQYIG